MISGRSSSELGQYCLRKTEGLYLECSLVLRSISLCPRLFVPTSLCAQVSMCPKKWYFVPTSLCAPKKWYFVPTSLCAHVSLCPRLYMPKPMPVGVVGRFPKQTSGQAMAKLTSSQAMVKLTSVKQWPN